MKMTVTTTRNASVTGEIFAAADAPAVLRPALASAGIQYVVQDAKKFHAVATAENIRVSAAFDAAHAAFVGKNRDAEEYFASYERTSRAMKACD